MSAFTEISGRELRRLDGLLADLGMLSDFDAVERAFVQMGPELMPGDFIGWNNWSLGMDTPLSSRCGEVYAPTMARLIEPLNALVCHHPVIARGAWLSPDSVFELRSPIAA